MPEGSRRPLWPVLTALLVLLPVLYVASFGPALWLCNKTRSGVSIVNVIYRPLLWAMSSGSVPHWIDGLYRDYILWCTDRAE